jgi:hypothetical protein
VVTSRPSFSICSGTFFFGGGGFGTLREMDAVATQSGSLDALGRSLGVLRPWEKLED